MKPEWLCCSHCAVNGQKLGGKFELLGKVLPLQGAGLEQVWKTQGHRTAE